MSKPKFFERQSLFTPPYAEHDVRGDTLRFYPLSVNMLWQMRAAVEPIAQALRLLSSGKNDYEQTVDQGVDEETGEKRTVTHIGAVKPELASMRESRMDDQVKKAFDTFFDPKMRDFVGGLITDSLREDFTRAEARDPGVIKLLMDGNDEQSGLDLATLGEMVTGIVKANEGVFGPFAQRIKETLSAKMATVLDDVNEHGTQATSDFDDSTRSELDERPEREQPEETLSPNQ